MSDDIFDEPELENDLTPSELDQEPETVGETSDEQKLDASDADRSEDHDEESTEKKKFEFSVYDTLLLVSLICVTLATLLLVLELRRIDSSFPFSFPWRTSEVLNVLVPWSF
jgi:hypothetical protein